MDHRYIDHHYIDDHNVAEQYLSDALPEDVRAAFADHVITCEECWDRLQLAQMWLEHQAQPARMHSETKGSQDVFEEVFEDVSQDVHRHRFYTEQSVTAAHMTHVHAGGAPSAFAGETSTALTVTVRHWQVPTLTTLAAMLAVTLEYIHQQQIELARRDGGVDSSRLPKLAQFVLQFEPWQLLLIGALAALVLVMLPATWFFWELKQISWR